MRDIASILVNALAAAVIGGDYRQAPEDKALAADTRGSSFPVHGERRDLR